MDVQWPLGLHHTNTPLSCPQCCHNNPNKMTEKVTCFKISHCWFITTQFWLLNLWNDLTGCLLIFRAKFDGECNKDNDPRPHGRLKITTMSSTNAKQLGTSNWEAAEIVYYNDSTPCRQSRTTSGWWWAATGWSSRCWNKRTPTVRRMTWQC